MTRKIYPLFFCLLIHFLSKAQTDTTIAWEKVLGGSYDSHAREVKPTMDNGCIIAGSTLANDGDVSGNHGDGDAWIVKLDASGNTQWQKCLGGTGSDIANSIQQTADGGYIIAGTTNSNNGDVSGNHSTNSNNDVWIIKISATGAIQWQKCFGGSNNDVANSIVITTDKGYVFTAGTNSTDGDVTNAHSDTSYWVVKIDSIGVIQWQRFFNGAAFSVSGYGYTDENNPTNGFDYSYYNGSFIQSTADKGFIIAAQGDSTVTDNHGGLDYLIVKLDSAGGTLWQKSFGTSNNDVVTCIRQVGAAGGYIVAGNTTLLDTIHNTGPNYLQVPLIIKLDNSGTIQWQQLDSLSFSTHSNSFYKEFVISANAVSIASNGDYVICGYASGRYSLGTATFGWLTRLDSTGNSKGIAYPNGFLYSSTLAGDGGFIAAGDEYEFRNYQDSTFVAHLYIVKFKSTTLPVTILNFTATPQKNNVLTQWQTGSEENTSYFNVQRSTDAEHFTTVGKVNATGNSTALLNYAYTDDVSSLITTYSSLYYRLQEVDKNGNVTLSKIARVVFPAKGISLVASPNPVKGQLNVRLNNYSGNATICVYDMVGHKLQQVTQYTNSTNAITINTASFAAGTYIITTVVNGVMLEEKFVKK